MSTRPAPVNLAFYAPMKPPTDPSPSGDRTVGRLLMPALRAAGHEVELASTFRSWEGQGDAGRQRRLRRIGERLGRRLIRRYLARGAQDRPRLWFTYHLYHRAPDWIGPLVSRRLGIPYVVAEASYARTQTGGPWAEGLAASVRAIRQADAELLVGPGCMCGSALQDGTVFICSVWLRLAKDGRQPMPVCRVWEKNVFSAKLGFVLFHRCDSAVDITFHIIFAAEIVQAVT